MSECHETLVNGCGTGGDHVDSPHDSMDTHQSKRKQTRPSYTEGPDSKVITEPGDASLQYGTLKNNNKKKKITPLIIFWILLKFKNSLSRAAPTSLTHEPRERQFLFIHRF